MIKNLFYRLFGSQQKKAFKSVYDIITEIIGLEYPGIYQSIILQSYQSAKVNSAKNILEYQTNPEFSEADLHFELSPKEKNCRIKGFEILDKNRGEYKKFEVEILCGSIRYVFLPDGDFPDQFDLNSIKANAISIS